MRMPEGALFASSRTIPAFTRFLGEALCLLLVALLPVPGMAGAVMQPMSLQARIDAAEENAVLLLEAGTYAGPVVIDKPLTLDGRGAATIDAGGKGSVISIETDGATLKGLHLTNSGESHNDIDAGVRVRGDFNVLKDLVIDNCLFGIDLGQASNNIIKRNRISSKPFTLGLRGDAIRLWYSFNNKVTDNVIRDSRDTVVWYSADNLIARNDARRGRYSLHFMYSKHNDVIDNHYENNAVGIFLMYSDGVVIRNNLIANANGPTGMGIGFKESSDVEIAHNQLLYNAIGIYLDLSPFQPDTTNRIHDNIIAFSGIGISFLSDWPGNVIRGNDFRGNITQVAVSGNGKSVDRNTWDGNYWDDYEGFDLNHDGIGDHAYELYSYADRIWMDVPPARFFKGTPMLETLDFLERLAPFSKPSRLLSDARPLIEPRFTEKLLARRHNEDNADAASNDNTADRSAESDAYRKLRQSLGR